MKDVSDLHRDAMELADQGLIARRRGNSAHAKKLIRQAFEKEKTAALLVEKNLSFEPTRSVLLRSAASLALECVELREAEKLISLALSGNPQEEIAEELRDLLEKVNFDRHLKLKGIELQSDEFQFVLQGAAVGPGFVQTTHLTDRIRDIESLIHRTSERKLQHPFREGGRKRKSLTLFQSIPRAASYAITFRIGEIQQLVLPGTSFAESVIDEIFECFSLINNAELDRLNKRISEESYYRNFVSLARGISPDGKNIRTIGMTIFRTGQEKSLLLDKTKENIPIIEPTKLDIEPREPIEIVGTLKYADATDEEKGVIKLIDDRGHKHRIRVPPGLMTDIVRPMFDLTVRVKGRKDRNVIVLDTIDKLEEGQKMRRNYRQFLGNTNTEEVHDLDNEIQNCQIDEILAAGHGRYFVPDTLDQAHREGYDNCNYCIGGSLR